MYTAYVTATEYVEMGFADVPVEELDRYLLEASRNIDTLTFNRIVAKGFDNLTEFQQELIKEVCCRQASFLYENAGAIASIIDSYSINGVSMQFGKGFNIAIECGLPIQKTVYSLLEQTGLCWRAI